MTKAEVFEKAWRLGFKGDFSLVDEIYHSDYKSFDYRTGIEANIEDDKVIASTLGESVILDPIERCLRMKTFCVLRGSQSDLQI